MLCLSCRRQAQTVRSRSLPRPQSKPGRMKNPACQCHTQCSKSTRQNHLQCGTINQLISWYIHTLWLYGCICELFFIPYVIMSFWHELLVQPVHVISSPTFPNSLSLKKVCRNPGLSLLCCSIRWSSPEVLRCYCSNGLSTFNVWFRPLA